MVGSFPLLLPRCHRSRLGLSYGALVAGATAEPKRAQEEVSGAKAPAAPAVSFQGDGPKKQKVIFSPADDIDDDEKSYWAPNPPLLAFFFIFPVAVYLFFYVPHLYTLNSVICGQAINTLWRCLVPG